MNEKNILAIDSSSPALYVSLKTGSGFKTEIQRQENSHHEKIDELVRTLLSGSPMPDILLVGAGPGSFTGLRISYAYLKGLAFSLGVPLYHLSGLEAAAFAAPPLHEEGIVCCLLDAGRGEYFAAASKASSGKKAVVLEPQIMSLEGLSAFLKPHPEPLVIDLGQAPGSRIGEYVTGQPPVISQALIMRFSALRALEPPDLAELSPLYLRAVQAKSLKERGIELKEMTID